MVGGVEGHDHGYDSLGCEIEHKEGARGKPGAVFLQQPVQGAEDEILGLFRQKVKYELLDHGDELLVREVCENGEQEEDEGEKRHEEIVGDGRGPLVEHPLCKPLHEKAEHIVYGYAVESRQYYAFHFSDGTAGCHPCGRQPYFFYLIGNLFL